LLCRYARIWSSTTAFAARKSSSSGNGEGADADLPPLPAAVRGDDGIAAARPGTPLPRTELRTELRTTEGGRDKLLRRFPYIRGLNASASSYSSSSSTSTALGEQPSANGSAACVGVDPLAAASAPTEGALAFDWAGGGPAWPR